MTSLLALPRSDRSSVTDRIRDLDRGRWVPRVGSLGWQLLTSHPLWTASKPLALRSLRRFLRDAVRREGVWWLEVLDRPATSIAEPERRWIEPPWSEWCADGR